MSRPSTYHQASNLSTSSSLQSSTATNTLQSRILAKRTELQNLQQLRDLSAQLASQMTALEQKLSTLRDGTETVAHVLANWESVLGVIGMVGARAGVALGGKDGREEEEEEVEDDSEQKKAVLPETLVRIPVQEDGGSVEKQGQKVNG